MLNPIAPVTEFQEKLTGSATLFAWFAGLTSVIDVGQAAAVLKLRCVDLTMLQSLAVASTYHTTSALAPTRSLHEVTVGGMSAVLILDGSAPLMPMYRLYPDAFADGFQLMGAGSATPVARLSGSLSSTAVGHAAVL